MRSGPLCRAASIAVLLAGAGPSGAQAIGVPELQRLLQAAPLREARFHETRESPWLSAPVQSSGTMKSNAGALEKDIQEPRREMWRILDDRIQLIVPGAAAAKEVMLTESPAVAVLARAWRQVMAGDLQALDQDFRLVPGGDARLWTLSMTPRHPDIARGLKQLELQGTGARMQVIVIHESQGERTTTRLTYEP